MNPSLLIDLNDFLNDNDLSLDSDDFDFITGINWKTNLPLICKKCGHKFSITTKQLLKPHPERIGKVCSRCNSEDLFNNKLKDLYGKNPYTFLTHFNGYTKPIKVKCNDCGYEWKTNAAKNLLMNNELPNGLHPCKKCSNKRNYKKSSETFKKIMIEKFGQCNYELLDEDFLGIYSKKKIKVRCLKCGSEFSVAPSNLFSPNNGKHYCKNCNIKNKNGNIL